MRSHYTTNIQSFFPGIAEENEKASEREIACAIQQRLPIFLPCLCVSPSLARHALSRAHISCDCYVAQAITLPSGFIAVRIIFACFHWSKSITRLTLLRVCSGVKHASLSGFSYEPIYVSTVTAPPLCFCTCNT